MRIITLIAALFLVTGLAQAEYDLAGNELGSYDLGDDPGDPCGDCPAPHSNDRGTTYKDGDLWVQGETTLYHLVDCTVVETLPLSGVTGLMGLGYDSSRDLWIVTSFNGYLYTLDPAGQLVQTFNTPTARPVGCDYDPDRDVYWVCDWQSNQVYSMDPVSGGLVTMYNVAGMRQAGVGYLHDVITYNAREESLAHWIDADDGTPLASAPIPFGGSNNGQGSSVDPATGNVWIPHYDLDLIFCLEGMGPSATESATWGQIKNVFK